MGHILHIAFALLLSLTAPNAAHADTKIPLAKTPVKTQTESGLIAPMVTNLEAQTAEYFYTISNNPEALKIFIDNLPKGGDLHSHLSGASYAENLVRYGMQQPYCINSQNFTVSIAKSKECNGINLSELPHYPQLYNNVINAWSMRNFNFRDKSGYDHFFQSFDHFFPIVANHRGEILAETVKRAAAEKTDYLELMFGDKYQIAINLANKIQWNNDFARARSDLFKHGLGQLVHDISFDLDQQINTMDNIMKCGTAESDPGCNVTVKFQYSALRNRPPHEVFAQLLAGFAVAQQDPRIVAINIVAPEDDFYALRDYALHMQMIRYLHQQYPTVHISLHAGELNAELLPPEGLHNHIRQAIEIAGAERIGNGVDIASETDAIQLMNEMAQKQIPVEINLTSNADILNVNGTSHPLPLYLENYVPVTLNTDNAGVLRTDLNREYLRAVTTYHLSYSTLKQIDRNSLTYSFLPGQSLWQQAELARPVVACTQQPLGDAHPSKPCQDFLDHNEKARMQWKLEQQLASFERKTLT